MNWHGAFMGALGAVHPFLHTEVQKNIVDTLHKASHESAMETFYQYGGLRVGGDTLQWFDGKYEIKWQHE